MKWEIWSILSKQRFPLSEANSMFKIFPKNELDKKMPIRNYEEKFNKAREFLISKGITEIKPLIKNEDDYNERRMG